MPKGKQVMNMAWKAKLADPKGPCSSCVMDGVYRALAYSQGCAVVFHSARGCEQIASTMDVNSQFLLVGEGRQETSDAVPLLSSNLREKDCIFGGADRLRGALRYTAETYYPECMAVAVSCTTGLIGDDAEAVCAEAEEELGVPVHISPAAGFLGGTYTDGYRVMMAQIMNRFSTRGSTRRGRSSCWEAREDRESSTRRKYKKFSSGLGWRRGGSFQAMCPSGNGQTFLPHPWG